MSLTPARGIIAVLAVTAVGLTVYGNRYSPDSDGPAGLSGNPNSVAQSSATPRLPYELINELKAKADEHRAEGKVTRLVSTLTTLSERHSYAPAELELARIFRHGKGNVEEDWQQAKQWYERAIENRSSTAALELGDLLIAEGQQGEAVANAYEKAMTSGVLTGEEYARLAHIKFTGLHGVEADIEVARNLLLSASQRGHTPSMAKLGGFLVLVEDARAEGYGWLLLAERRGHSDARRLLDKHADKLTPEQKELAPKLADAFAEAVK
ncbi:MAG: hypothetical protein Alpg2KO_05140 [Alphaproteobacteria bacterium]